VGAQASRSLGSSVAVRARNAVDARRDCGTAEQIRLVERGPEKSAVVTGTMRTEDLPEFLGATRGSGRGPSSAACLTNRRAHRAMPPGQPDGFDDEARFAASGVVIPFGYVVPLKPAWRTSRICAYAAAATTA
jgi:hypothetical protein